MTDPAEILSRICELCSAMRRDELPSPDRLAQFVTPDQRADIGGGALRFAAWIQQFAVLTRPPISGLVNVEGKVRSPSYADSKARA